MADPESVELRKKIHQALEIVHSSASTNDARRDAQVFLEDVKAQHDALFQGYALATELNRPPVIRHYGLSLLEHTTKYSYGRFSDEELSALRGWIVQLSKDLKEDDPIYIRTKTASLWVETAKRGWGAHWLDMDELLVRLWHIPDTTVHKDLVMTVLESLAEEVFGGDDSVVAMREGVLSKACVEIFTPAAVLDATFSNREPVSEVRCGEDGWLARLASLLRQILHLEADRIPSAVAVKALSVLTALMSWIMPKAIVATDCVGVLCVALSSPHVAIQKGGLDALHMLYSRTSFSESEFNTLVVPMFSHEMVDLCRRLYHWSTVPANDIDEDKYQFVKKFSEMLSCLGRFVERRTTTPPTDDRLDGFFGLLMEVLQSDSLVVSIPVLVSINGLVNNRMLASRFDPYIGQLLEICSARLLRYEYLPEDTQDPIFLFLLEDTDTLPERHAFIGNYRKYGVSVIQSIIQSKLSDALYHVLAHCDTVLSQFYQDRSMPNKQNYVKHSPESLRVDAQLTVVEAAVKAFMRWKRETNPETQDQTRVSLEQSFESWCTQLMGRTFEDPQIRKRILQVLVMFSTTALRRSAGFMLKVLEHILMTWPTLEPEHRLFNESIKELQSESTIELQRLAVEMPDNLIEVYEQLESRVNEMLSSGTLDEKRSVAYQGFLFLIMLEPSTKIQRLQGFVSPVQALWQTEDAKRSLSSFPAYCEMLGLDQAQSYLTSHHVHQTKDWGSKELGADGLALQLDLDRRSKASLLPLRLTKSFLMNSVERLEKDSATFQVSYALWRDALPMILSDLLQLLSHAHASHNPENWVGLAGDARAFVVKKVLSDRFWQAGISDGSKDEFYARVVDKKATLEGLASSIRGSIRFVRETCYAIICLMSQFDGLFYGFSELPGPLAQALFSNSTHLSSHQQISLLQLAKYFVEDCPAEHREAFLPPLLGACFQQMDAKIMFEWSMIDQQGTIEAKGEALQEEMKSESILRQVTHSAVLLAAELLDPNKHNTVPASVENEQPAKPPNAYPALRRFCLLQSRILEPLMLFSTHAIRMRDSRACNIILRVFRSILPEFVPQQQVANNGHVAPEEPASEQWALPQETMSAIREYISSDVLKACMESFHDPYFSDLQKDLATLIAQIVVYYGPYTSTGRNLLMSLPNVDDDDVNKLSAFMSKPASNTRAQRALILNMLQDLKGVSITEMGKIAKDMGSIRPKRADRSKMAQDFMMAPETVVRMAGIPRNGGGGVGSNDTDGLLEGVASLFAE